MKGNTLDGIRLSTPKLPPAPHARWYRYYAGYSEVFVEDIVGGILPPRHQHLLDPWMGSGTTLASAARKEHHVSGFDLNPAMVVVTKGRLIATDTEASIPPLTHQIIHSWGTSPPVSGDPLSQWFDQDTTARIRGGARVIGQLLASDAASPSELVDTMSSLACFFYVALFETVGSSLRSYSSRNPTWIKRSRLNEGTARVSLADLHETFHAATNRLAAHIARFGSLDTSARDRARIETGDSRVLAHEDLSVDSVVTSPPYLTRLDYVVGHLPELSVLGFDQSDAVALRDRMIGTPTTGTATSDVALGEVIESLLASIATHDSYAAKSYYEPNFRRYFEGMGDSLAEIDRALRDNGDVVMVVQDSWFKGIHLDLAKYLASEASNQGWELVGRRDFPNARSIVQLNRGADAAARERRPVESVLHFRK